MTHTITIDSERLSDGSEVFDVRLGGVAFHCVTIADAIALADSLVDLVAKHTVDDYQLR